MKMLLAGNVPQFHVKPSEEAYKRVHDGLRKILEDDPNSATFYPKLKVTMDFAFFATINDEKVKNSHP